MIVGDSRRAVCWRPHPAIIASNNAGSGRSGVAPPTNTSAAEPAGLPIAASPALPVAQHHTEAPDAT